MIFASFRDLLTKASFGPITLGTARRRVISLLGDPTDQSESRKPLLYKYGAIQLAFDLQNKTEPCCFVGVYFRDVPFSVPVGVQLDGWWPQSGSTLLAFQDFCDQAMIKRTPCPSLSFDDQVAFSTECGASVVCTKSNSGEWIIDSVQCLPLLKANQAVNGSRR